jgi:hypothetical protein
MTWQLTRGFFIKEIRETKKKKKRTKKLRKGKGRY